MGDTVSVNISEFHDFTPSGIRHYRYYGGKVDGEPDSITLTLAVFIIPPCATIKPYNFC